MKRSHNLTSFAWLIIGIVGLLVAGFLFAIWIAADYLPVHEGF